MSVLLVGDATDSFPLGQATYASDGRPDAFKFTAAERGLINELRFRTDERTQGFTTLELALWSDVDDAPGIPLGAGLYSGEAAPSTWLSVTGMSASIEPGRDYWLVVLPHGGNVYFTTADPTGDGGTEELYAGAGHSTMPSTWPTGADLYHTGPLGFQALGVAKPSRPSDLVWHVTGLWRPGATSVPYYGRIANPADDSYIDTLNDQSTGEVTLSIDDNAELATHLIGHAYARMLKVYDTGRLAYWGPYKLGRIDMAARTCTLNTVDPSLRLARHYLRRGDLVIGAGAVGGLTAENDDKSQVPVDHTGLRLLRDAALNTEEQNDEGYPDLGIIDGTNDYVATPFDLMGVQRGDQVFSQMQQLSESLGPDFEFEPIEDVVGAYAQMNTYTHQGADVSAEVVFHFGTGKKNLENLVVDEGAKYTTHVHVLPRDEEGQRKYRFTEPNPAAALETGPYVDWDATDYDSTGIPDDKVEKVLRAYGKDVIAAYGRPLIQVTMTLPLDGPGVPRYGIDFKVGDTVGVAGRVVTLGVVPNVDIPVAPYRITSVRRKRDGEGIRSEITAVGDMVAALGDSTGGDSEA